MQYSDDELEPPAAIGSDTENRTKIQAQDAPNGKEQKFQRFRAYNRGTWNGPKREETEVLRRQDDLQRYDSIASSVLPNEFQKQRGRTLLDNFDLHNFGQSIDRAIFGICVLVANDDVDDGSRYYPGQVADKHFSDLAESLGFDRRTQLQAIEKVRTRIDL